MSSSSSSCVRRCRRQYYDYTAVPWATCPRANDHRHPCRRQSPLSPTVTYPSIRWSPLVASLTEPPPHHSPVSLSPTHSPDGEPHSLHLCQSVTRQCMVVNTCSSLSSPVHLPSGQPPLQYSHSPSYLGRQPPSLLLFPHSLSSRGVPLSQTAVPCLLALLAWATLAPLCLVVLLGVILLSLGHLSKPKTHRNLSSQHLPLLASRAISHFCTISAFLVSSISFWTFHSSPSWSVFSFPCHKSQQVKLMNKQSTGSRRAASGWLHKVLVLSLVYLTLAEPFLVCASSIYSNGNPPPSSHGGGSRRQPKRNLRLGQRSPAKPNYTFFEETDPNVVFSHMAVNVYNGYIYLGALNGIYQLKLNSSKLSLEAKAIMGPMEDSSDCPATKRCPPNVSKKLSAYHNKALVIDMQHNWLISCGSLYQGACVAHSWHNVSLCCCCCASEPEMLTSLSTLYPGFADSPHACGIGGGEQCHRLNGRLHCAWSATSQVSPLRGRYLHAGQLPKRCAGRLFEITL